jgi:hypothetical protein
MIIRLIVALILSALTATSAIADDIYRWTDPESGKVLVTPNPPSYPIKEQRTAGRLPNGNVVELILDTNAPEVKALIEKRRVREAEQKRIVEEAARQRAAKEAEEKRIAEEQARQKPARDAELEKERTSQKENSTDKKLESTKQNRLQEDSSQLKKQEHYGSDTLDADTLVKLINVMYGNVCHAEINGFFSKTLKLDWTANTKKIHAIKVMAEIGSIKEKLYRDGVRYFQFPNDIGTYNVIDWETGEKKSISERTNYYFSN